MRLLTRTLAFGVYDHNLVCAREDAAEQRWLPATRAGQGVLRERLWKIRARARRRGRRRVRAADDFPGQRSARA